METIREIIETKENTSLFPAEFFGEYSVAVLDIETLGLSPANAPIILCGVVFPEKEETIALQFLAERPGEEEEALMLEALEDALSDREVVVTYNGIAFDIPYIETRREILGLPPSKTRYQLDLLPFYRHCSELRSFLPNLSQTTVEAFFGFWDSRTDTIGGKESISLYLEYIQNDDEDARAAVLLHNRDDIVQLHRLTGTLTRVDMHKGLFRYGFPVGRGEDLAIVRKIALKKDVLTAEGIYPRHIMDNVRYGDFGPSWRMENGEFVLKIPLSPVEHLLVADLGKLEREGFCELVPGEDMVEDYLVLSAGDTIDYAHCNRLVKGVLERMKETWITEN